MHKERSGILERKLNSCCWTFSGWESIFIPYQAVHRKFCYTGWVWSEEKSFDNCYLYFQFS